MFAAGFIMLLLAGAAASVYGLATTVAVALGRSAPLLLPSAQSFVVRVGGADLWYTVVTPIMEAPCWAPLLALSIVFVTIGILRRL